MEDSSDEFALLRMVRDDGRESVARGFGVSFELESEVGLPGGGVGAVTGEAGVGEDGQDVSVEAELLPYCRKTNEEEEERPRDHWEWANFLRGASLRVRWRERVP
jgi:hypothetical protein